MTRFVLPYWADLHAHIRQGDLVAPLLAAHASMGCYAVLAMPNTKPPITEVVGTEPNSISGYLDMLLKAGGDVFNDIIVPLYLNPKTTAFTIKEGVRAGLLRAAKYYPPHGTTNSSHGLPMAELLKGDVLKAMESEGIILCIHGEQHGLSGEEYFGQHGNAESRFYDEMMPRVLDRVPNLRIVCEHITTAKAVRFVQDAGKNVRATITPQHLLYTAGTLVQTWSAHLRCMPLVKFSADRRALLDAVMSLDNTQFFAGTDSAPHPQGDKISDCGCAAGCYVGGIAPQLYAQAFEEGGADLSRVFDCERFVNFLCRIGPDFYGIPRSCKTFTLIREPQEVHPVNMAGTTVVPLPAGLPVDLEEYPDGIARIPWRLEL